MIENRFKRLKTNIYATEQKFKLGDGVWNTLQKEGESEKMDL